MNNNYPKKVIIEGIEFKITYTDNPSEVDSEKRESLWGQIDYWNHTIKIYDKNSPPGRITELILHEILHGIAYLGSIECLEDKDNHGDLTKLGVVLADTLVRNGWLRIIKTDEYLEKLADIQHKIWANWMTYLFSKCQMNPQGTAKIPKNLVDRWKKQIDTNYSDLTEKEKQLDRDQVMKFWDLI